MESFHQNILRMTSPQHMKGFLTFNDYDKMIISQKDFPYNYVNSQPYHFDTVEDIMFE